MSAAFSSHVSRALRLGVATLAMWMAFVKPAGAEAPQESIDLHLSALVADLPEQAQQALVHISGLERRLLAVRSYLRAGPQLPEKWSWTAQQIEAFEISPDYQRFRESVQRVIDEFERRNPGYTLFVNMKARPLELQLQRWNSNPGVQRVAASLYRSLLGHEWATAACAEPCAASVQSLRNFLLDWRPPAAAPLAAPGLSAHGQLRAVDFQVSRAGRIVAGTTIATVPHEWDKSGWRARLQRAVQAADARFVGPLMSPNEPWHYTYLPSALTADSEAGETPGAQRRMRGESG
ncbi:MAG TPA: hypothetical protein VK025_05285 [Steroidobacter sp.]|nr:hypothetical protein [Steroidobacteraceae bacterium]HLS80796.1 hypothetical protein [Steroidobacter sp.]